MKNIVNIVRRSWRSVQQKGLGMSLDDISTRLSSRERVSQLRGAGVGTMRGFERILPLSPVWGEGPFRNMNIPLSSDL